MKQLIQEAIEECGFKLEHPRSNEEIKLKDNQIQIASNKVSSGFILEYVEDEVSIYRNSSSISGKTVGVWNGRINTKEELKLILTIKLK